MSESALDHLLLFGIGGLAGTLNVIAGGGSFLTLPIMILLGLPATVANGTNRVAIFVQNVGAVWSFRRHRILDWRWLRPMVLPALAGAALGTWAALEVGDAAFERVLAFLMVAVSLWTLWDPLRGQALEAGGRAGALDGDALDDAVPLWLVGSFFLVGLYGGFVQAGVGFFILAVSTLGGLDLVRGNALKVLVVLIWTPLALALFALAGAVDWSMGLALAAGNLLGGLLGVRLTVLRGHGWVKRVVTVAVIALAVKLLLDG